MRPLPAVWKRDEGRWIVTSPFALMPHQLRAIRDYLLPVQRQRRASLFPGDVRDDLDLAIVALERGRIACGFTGGDVFKSTRGTGKIITMGAH